MWWTQFGILLMGILVNCQDAQSEVLGSDQLNKALTDILLHVSNVVFGECDALKENKNLIHEWTNLVSRETLKVIESMGRFLEKKLEHSDEESSEEHYRSSGFLEELEKELTKAKIVLKAFCNQQNGMDVATRILSNAVINAISPLFQSDLVARLTPEQSKNFKKYFELNDTQ